MDDDKPAKLTISGKLTFEDNITLSQAAQIVAFLDSQNNPSGSLIVSPSGGPRLTMPGGGGRLSGNPRDALNSSGAKTNAERIVAFALYISQDGAKETFTLEDIKPLFRRARETPPGNISRDFITAIKAGWVAETEVSGEFYVTDKASQVLEDGFETLRGSGGKSRSSGAPKSKKPATVPEVFKSSDTISPTIDGLVGYHKLKTKTDKFLWALYTAKSLGVKELTNQELVWLTDQLGDGISTNDIGGNYRQNHKSGYVNRSTQNHKIRITPQGEQYLKSKTEF